MALKTWTHGSTVRRTGGTTNTYGRFDLSWSGLPSNIKIKRIYWQWDVERQKGSTYARWYAGTSGNTLYGSTGNSGKGYTFDVTSITDLTGDNGIAWVYLGAQNGGVDYSNISFNVEFDYLQSSFSLSSVSVEAGKTITANITIQDTTATHKATWKFGTEESITTSTEGVTANSFTVPLAWLEQIPNAASGIASCTLETISSDGVSVGSSTQYFDIVVPANVVPIITYLEVTRVDNNVPSDWGVYVQSQSGVTIEVFDEGQYGATISKRSLSGDGKKSSSSTLKVTQLSGSGTLSFKATVKDSRGRTASKTITIDVLPWTKPVVRELSAVRATSNGAVDPLGESVYVTLKGAISSVDGKNSATTKVFYREYGSTGAWTQEGEGSSVKGSWTILKNEASLTKAYEVQVQLSDAFATATVSTVCATAGCYIDKMPGKRRLGIGGYCPGDNTFYVAGDMAFRWGDRNLVPGALNLLDNSDFTSPVNQRGATEYAYGTAKYTIDRWVTYCGVKVDSRGYVTVTNGDTGAFNFYQDFPLGTLDGSKTYTAAVKLATGELYVGSGVPVEGSSVDLFRGSKFDISMRKNFRNDNKDRFYVHVLAGQSIDIVWVALYEGEYTADSLPEYVPKGYAAEWFACRRYFRTWRPDSPYQTAFNGFITGSTKSVVVNLGEGGMRVVPTLAATSGSGVILRHSGGYSADASYEAPCTDFTLEAYDIGGQLNMCLKKADGSAWADVANNTPVSINLSSGTVLTASADI